MGKLIIEIDTSGMNVIGEPLNLLADVLLQIGDNIPQMAFAIIPAEPKQHPSFVPGKGVALVFEASKEDSASPEEAKIAVRMGFVSDEFDTSQWRALKADPCNVAVIRDGKLGG